MSNLTLQNKIKPKTKKVVTIQDMLEARIIKKNLVYIIGLSQKVANRELLMKYEYLAQYGKIIKIVVNKNKAYNANNPKGPSYSAYVTYAKSSDASIAILSIDSCVVDEHLVRASFGTTKYCTFYLKNQECPNKECLFLHEASDENDIICKEDLNCNKNIFMDQQIYAMKIANIFDIEIKKKILEGINKKIKTIFPSADSLYLKDVVKKHEISYNGNSISTNLQQSKNPALTINKITNNLIPNAKKESNFIDNKTSFGINNPQKIKAYNKSYEEDENLKNAHNNKISDKYTLDKDSSNFNFSRKGSLNNLGFDINDESTTNQKNYDLIEEKLDSINIKITKTHSENFVSISNIELNFNGNNHKRRYDSNNSSRTKMSSNVLNNNINPYNPINQNNLIKINFENTNYEKDSQQNETTSTSSKEDNFSKDLENNNFLNYNKESTKANDYKNYIKDDNFNFDRTKYEQTIQPKLQLYNLRQTSRFNFGNNIGNNSDFCRFNSNSYIEDKDAIIIPNFVFEIIKKKLSTHKVFNKINFKEDILYKDEILEKEYRNFNKWAEFIIENKIADLDKELIEEYENINTALNNKFTFFYIK